MSRGSLSVIAAICLVEACADAAQGGFYNPAKPDSPLVHAGAVRALHIDELRDLLSELLLTVDTVRKPNPPRETALKRRDELLKLGRRASVNDLVELGLLQWRLGEADRALETLNRAKSLDPRSFWALNQLGSLYFATGQYAEAAGHLGPSLAAFPSPWPGAPAQGQWLRQCERAQLAVLRSRLSESGGRPARRNAPTNSVDNLFPVKFVGPSGQYEAGALADEEKTKLPADAIATVQQLLLWYPEDTRLYWLLGELYNATGDIRSAEKVFDDCVSGTRRFDSPTLREHRRIVKEAIEAETAAAAAKKESFWPSWPTLVLVGGLGSLMAGGLLVLQIRELRARRNRRRAGQSHKV